MSQNVRETTVAAVINVSGLEDLQKADATLSEIGDVAGAAGKEVDKFGESAGKSAKQSKQLGENVSESSKEGIAGIDGLKNSAYDLTSALSGAAAAFSTWTAPIWASFTIFGIYAAIQGAKVKRMFFW